MKKNILILLLFISNLIFGQVTLISDDFNRASIGANYTTYGSISASIVSNQLQISGGNSGTSDKITYTSYLSTQKNVTFTTRITPTANGNGVKIMFQTPNNTLSIFGPGGVSLGFDESTSPSKRGLLKIKTIANNIETLKGTSAALTYTNSTQPIDLTIIITNSSVYFSAENSVTHQVVSTSFSDSSINILKRYQLSFVANGNGSVTLIDNPLLVSNTSDTTSLAVISHSMGAGANATDKRNGWVYLLSDSLIDGVNNFSGGGSCIQDAIDNIKCEYAKFYSPYTIIHLGTNDATISLTDTAFKIKLDTLIGRILARGSIPILCTELPTTDATKNLLIVKYNVKINSYSGTYTIIDFYTLMKLGTILNPAYDDGGGLHPNTAGHLKMYKYVRSLTSGIFAYK